MFLDLKYRLVVRDLSHGGGTHAHRGKVCPSLTDIPGSNLAANKKSKPSKRGYSPVECVTTKTESSSSSGSSGSSSGSNETPKLQLFDSALSQKDGSRSNVSFEWEAISKHKRFLLNIWQKENVFEVASDDREGMNLCGFNQAKLHSRFNIIEFSGFGRRRESPIMNFLGLSGLVTMYFKHLQS